MSGNDPKRGRPLKVDGSPWTYKNWYSENKTSLAESRKTKYETDPAYKAEVLKRNRLYRENKRKLNPRKPPPDHKPRLTQLIELNRNNETTTCPAYHIGVLAVKISRSIPTIYGWERNGILPKTPFWTGPENKKERLYTVEMIDVVFDCLQKRNGRVSVKDHSFFNEIRFKWADIGVIAQERQDGNGKST